MRNTTAVIGLILSALVLAGFYGCSPFPASQRIRIKSEKVDIIVARTMQSASDHCKKAGAKFLDDGRPVTAETMLRCCLIYPKHKGGYARIITSEESKDCTEHERCHLRNPGRPWICDALHMDGRDNAGRTIEVP